MQRLVTVKRARVDAVYAPSTYLTNTREPTGSTQGRLLLSMRDEDLNSLSIDCDALACEAGLPSDYDQPIRAKGEATVPQLYVRLGVVPALLSDGRTVLPATMALFNGHMIRAQLSLWTYDTRGFRGVACSLAAAVIEPNVLPTGIQELILA